ncbi:OX-2 membrane glycoprotein [Acipenser ruthenus]|uniref:OX-2 membrane glycoprotein n=1 Tax=Acipenser ruthenus TaxID=7906 RepID=A0A444V7Z9_ACIRT|nr:OX-2 membrane glycoprotein [Acipenser ruthenus]
MISYNDTGPSSHIDYFEKVLEDYDQRLTVSVGKYFNQNEYKVTNSKRYVLYDSSIIIDNVEKKDEGCYICSFNVSTQGTMNGRSCLTVIDYRRITIPDPRPKIALNGNATLTCILPEPNVTQFIWWKEDKLEDKLKKILTYNLTSYENLTKETKDLEFDNRRLTFAILTDFDVPAPSITIHNVQLEDEDCYICSFKLYPQGKINGKTCLTVIGIVEMNIEKFSTQSKDIIIVRCSVVGKPGPMVTWKTSENVTEHEMEIKEDDNGIVTIISNVTVDLSTFQANEITCIASQAHVNGQELEKTISLREIRDVRVSIVLGIIFVTLLIIVAVIASRSGRILPAVCVARITSLCLSNVEHGAVYENVGRTVYENVGPRERD